MKTTPPPVAPTIYSPNQRHELGFFHIWVVMAWNIVRSRELIWALFRRDFFAQYKKSFFGYGWVILAPIVGVLSWVFMQKTGVLKPGNVGVPYPAYVLIGSSMWGLFLSLYRSAAATLSSGGALIMQVNYPHEILLVKESGQQAANFLITMAANLLILSFFGIHLTWHALFFPLVLIPLFFIATAAGLVVSMISIVAVDANTLINTVLGLLLYLCPIVYARDPENHTLRTVIEWNPLTHLICSARDILLYGRLYQTSGFVYSSLLAFFLFLISWRLFYVSENKVIERMI